MKQKVAILIVFLVALPFVLADSAPPAAKLLVLYEGKELAGEFHAEFLACEAQDYSPGREIIPQLDISQQDAAGECYWKPFAPKRWGACEQSRCDFFPVPYGKTKVAVYVVALDKTFVTNAINADVGMNEYEIDLSANGSAAILLTSGIVIRHDKTENVTLETPQNRAMPKDWSATGPWQGFLVVFLLSLAITLAIELPVAWAYAAIRKLKPRKQFLLSVLYANLVSVPLLWLSIYILPGQLSLFAQGGVSTAVLLEAGVIVFEAYLLSRWNKKTLGFAQALMLSTMMNLASVLLPLLVLLS